MIECRVCHHRICYDELVGVQVHPAQPQGWLAYRCESCGHEEALPVESETLWRDLRVMSDTEFFIRPGRIVNECESHCMMEIEKLGPITTNEFLEFCEELKRR
jgi:hypothetical protein